MKLVLSLLLLSVPGDCHAAAGTEPFGFLMLDAGAREVAMGGAFTALAEGADALLYNPAGLARGSSHTAVLMHDEHFEGIRQEYAAYASPGGWGFSLNYLDFGDVPRTTVANPTGAGLGSVGLSDLAVSAGKGFRLGRGMAVGATLKYLRESIAGVVGQGFGVDVGVVAEDLPVRGLSAGVSLQNAGPGVTFDSARESLPLNIRIGLGFEPEAFGRKALFGLDVSKGRRDGPIAAVGAEARVAQDFPLRLGFSTRNDAGLGITFGLGWRRRSWEVDYAFVPYGDLGDAHRISISLKWPKRSGGAKPPGAGAP